MSPRSVEMTPVEIAQLVIAAYDPLDPRSIQTAIDVAGEVGLTAKAAEIAERAQAEAAA